MSKLIEDMYRGKFIPFGEQSINIDEYSRKTEQLLSAEKDLLTAYHIQIVRNCLTVS